MKKISTILHQYFENTGVQKSWFAKKIDMSPALLYQIMNLGTSLPKRYWFAIIEISNGKITLTDLLEDHFEDIEGFQFKDNGDPKSSIVYLTNFNKED